MRIAVLGLGRMGAPMARNLAEVGHQLTLYNRTRAKLPDLSSMGARGASTIAEAVAEAQVALTMVTDDGAEEALTFGPDGLLAHLPPGAIHLCMSTIGVETSRRLASAHAEKGQGYVAAPVFGRPGAAASRHIWIVAGGPEAQVMRCLGIFDALGRGLTQVGAVPELAHAVKLGGNLLTAAMVEGLSEVLAFGEKVGLAPAELLRVLNTALFKSPVVDAYGGLMVRHTFEPADLSLEQALQETRSILQASDDTETALPMADLLQSRLLAAEAKGFGAQDLSVLFRACRMDSGLEGPPDTRPEEPSSFPSPGMDSAPRPRRKKGTASPVPPAPEEADLSAPETAPGAEESELPEAAPAPEKPEPCALETTPEPEASDLPEATPDTEESGPCVPETLPEAEEPDLPEDDAEPEDPLSPFDGDPLATYPATSGERPVTLDLKRTTHFELLDGRVWAWHRENRYGTSWRSLDEVEQALRMVLFVRSQRHVLLHPETVLELKPLFGGRARARVGERLELEVGRAATRRLKELLGW